MNRIPFKKGDCVELTEAGLSQGLDGLNNRRTGIVLSDERPDGIVCIRRIGDWESARHYYHHTFWKLSGAAAGAGSGDQLNREASEALVRAACNAASDPQP